MYISLELSPTRNKFPSSFHCNYCRAIKLMLSSADTCTILTTLGEIIYCHMVSINKGMAYLRDTALHCVISRGALCIYFYSRWGWFVFSFFGFIFGYFAGTDFGY